jgi:ATP-dependent DNA ligase
MKNFVWLKPELVAQIEFTEWTADGHLRYSKFVGRRDDKDAGGGCAGRLKAGVRDILELNKVASGVAHLPQL